MQLHLLGKRDYLTLFLTQLLGAGNAGMAWTILVWALAQHAGNSAWLNISVLLFTLPTLAIATLGGQLGDRCNRQHLLSRLKLAEILVMALCAVALLLDSLLLLLPALSTLGIQAALASPVKHAHLAQMLGKSELTGGIALLTAGTYLAFPSGLTGAAVLIQSGHAPFAGLIFLLLAMLGYLASGFIPDVSTKATTRPWHWPIGRQIYTTLKPSLNQDPGLVRALWGQTWFWSLGLLQILLTPGLAYQWLHGGVGSGVLILTLLATGVAPGALLSVKLSRGGIEIGLIPMSALAMALLGLLTWALAGTWFVRISLVLLGIAAGLYIVPLRALVLSRTLKARGARITAAGNMLGALLGTAACLVAILLAWLGLTAVQLFLLIALLNLAVFIHGFAHVPQYMARFVVWLLTHSLYRVRHDNLGAIPEQGPAILVCNHVSFMDPPLILGAVKRPVRFVMAHTIFYNPIFSFIFRLVGAIPIAPRREDEAIYNRAFERIEDYLARGEIVCIFPEGGITRDGNIQEFKSGVEKIIQRAPVPVVPLAIQGMWGSYFSRHPDRGFGRRRWSRVCLVAGTPLAPARLDRHELQRRIAALRGQWP